MAKTAVDVKAELLGVVSLKQKKGEDGAKFRARLLKEINKKITDEQWDALSPDAQNWVNDSVEDLEQDKPVRPFPGDDAETEAEEAEEPAKPKASKKKSGKKAAKAEADEEPAEKPAKKAKTKKSKSSDGEVRSSGRGERMDVLYEIICGDPKLTKEEVVEEMTKRGYEITPATVQTFHYAAHRAMKALEKLGRLKKAS